MRDEKGRFIKGHRQIKGCEKGWFKKGQVGPGGENYIIKKGEHLSPVTEFKKGMQPTVTAFKKGIENRFWKGGKHTNAGYNRVYTLKHPKVKMTKNKYVLEHILIIEKKIGRYLNPGEIVHHINGNKQDNRIENLLLLKDRKAHRDIHREIQRFVYRLLQEEQAYYDHTTQQFILR